MRRWLDRRPETVNHSALGLVASLSVPRTTLLLMQLDVQKLDLVVSAVNQATKAMADATSRERGGLAGGMDPGGLLG